MPSRLGLVFLLGALAAPTALAIDVDALWDHRRPELSEQRFRAALDGAGADDQRILQTQIARTYGMRREFAKAREVLAQLEPTLASASAEVRVRYFLELGRSHRSPLHPPELRTPASVEQARASFLRAFELAQQARLDALAIDALHMMPFVEADADRQMEWNDKALRYLAQSTQADAKSWEGPLRNNVGHAKRLKGDYEGALGEFALSRAAYERAGRVTDVRIADWMVARTYRDQKRYDEALAIQLGLERAWAAEGSADPHVLQELEHLYRALGQEERAQHYASKRKAAQR